MAVGDAYVFPGFLTPVLTLLFFPKPPTTFLTCFCRGERRKYTGKESRLNRGSNSQPPGNESETLTTEPPGRGIYTLQNESSQGYTGSACLSVYVSVRVSVHVSVCVQNTSYLVSRTPSTVLLKLYLNFADTLIIY